MAELLKGKEVVDALNERLKVEVELLKEKGISPTLGIIRVGKKSEDMSYEKGAIKRAETIGIDVKSFVLEENTSQEQLIQLIEDVNQEESIHGVLLFRPLPKQFDDNAVRKALLASKDIDGITDQSMAGVFSGTELGYPPCTPQACMEILDHYNIDAAGKKVVIIGRSLVVGKPAAMMILQKNGTPTICHTKTKDMPAICQDAEILIVAAGKAKAIGTEYLNKKQIVIDVGINMSEDGKLCGDVDFEEAEKIVKAITPVPGGVGTVTTSMLMKHVVEAAKKRVR
ncbi:bifunctional 5,10-methylenetetrahydrofolate dehydrogenase/5,10-methenyltetrahydrofolate cyclohydrolase [Clostridium aminobutyricum]|uniref:Bifunctional protein FolD n=1 Tax=Clostridium aminobutyricum TaxID=33953 RepID=A0A939IFU0_CLOAM|nr:bifunctional 5,10-methylenetetrahydrofolate dehydrogenase/5,10-methenyltetrahydrofolate cyclohydrolase [Clostridium aminobutyricum]MBN7771895.1 bifunctional 5,10-methylenetetrahydrofolate dehydrogenase/5,10-methenyltetrahydrofolate cyclohydrolase [Clostridium aminobutyricum]